MSTMERATMRDFKLCGCDVTKSGGYWAGKCKRLAGHSGPHRLRMTHADSKAIKEMRRGEQ